VLAGIIAADYANSLKNGAFGIHFIGGVLLVNSES
jgi:hypothetical protein